MELVPIEPGSSLLAARWATPDEASHIVVVAETREAALPNRQVSVRVAGGLNHLLGLADNLARAWGPAAVVSLARVIARAMDSLNLPGLLTALHELVVFDERSGHSNYNSDFDRLFDGWVRPR